jgi:hypothetical protein
MQLIPLSPGHALWPAVSIFVHTAYLEYYGARPHALPARVVALVDPQERVLCAAGLRSAPEAFFSEFYLEAPMEEMIGERSGKCVDRSEIVEVAGLVSRTPALSVHFMRELILYGDTLGFNWAVFTATDRLERLLRRIDLPLITLGRAGRECVPAPDSWGSYYENDPTVLAIGREDLAPFLIRDEGRRLASAGRTAHG